MFRLHGGGSLIAKISLKIDELFPVFSQNFAHYFCQNFAEFSPNLTKKFRDFSKMQQGREHVRDVLKSRIKTGLKSRRLPRRSPVRRTADAAYRAVF